MASSYFRQQPGRQLDVSAFVAAFCPVSTSALVDRRAQRRQSHLALSAFVVLSLNQRLVCEPLASNTIHESCRAASRYGF
jgi:hypothetical protein